MKKQITQFIHQKTAIIVLLLFFGIQINTFAQEPTCYADVVIDNNVTICINNVGSENPAFALGAPNYTVLGAPGELYSLGSINSFLTVGFTDNALINDGSTANDLFIYEVGPSVEETDVWLLPANAATIATLTAIPLIPDADGFFLFGNVAGATSEIDIDQFAPGIPGGALVFDQVKLINPNTAGCIGNAGPDIDAVCALSTITCADNDGDGFTDCAGDCDDNDATIYPGAPGPQVVNCWDDFQLDTEICEYVNVGVEPTTPTLVLADTDLCIGEDLIITIQGPPNATYQYTLNGVNGLGNSPFADDNGYLSFSNPLFSTPAGTYEVILSSYTVDGAFLEGCTTPIDVRVEYDIIIPEEPEVVNCWDDFQLDGATCTYVNQGEQPAQPEMVNCYDEFEFDTENCVWNNVGVQPEEPTDPDCNGTAVFNDETCSWDEIPDANYDCNIAIVVAAGTFPQTFPDFANDADGDGLADNSAFTVCDGSDFVTRIQSNLPYAVPVQAVIIFPEGLLSGGNPYPAGTVNIGFGDIPPTGSATNGVFQPTLTNPTSETLCIDYTLTASDPQCSDCQSTPVNYQICFPPAAVEPPAENCWDDYQFDGATCTYVNQGEQPAQPEMVNCYDEFEFDTENCVWNNIGGDVTDGGHISGDESLCGSTNDPANITSSTDASGSGAIEYLWLMNTTTSTPPTTNNMNGWVMIPNSNSPTYNPGPISETTWYLRCARPVGCTDYNGESNIIEKTYESSCYCASYGESTDYEWIESITVNGTENISGNDGGYADYTSIVLPISTGSNSLTLTPGFAGNSYNEYWVVSIDYNQNGVFDSNEYAYYNNSYGTINGNFNVPLTALTGETRMRIAMRYGGWPYPCDVFGEGEVEDYTVNITFCDNVTDGGHINEDEILCDGNFDPAQMTSSTDASGGSGGDIEYLWLMNTTTSTPPASYSMNGWVEIPNSNSPDYDPAPISETTWYLRCARRNGCGTYPGESNVIKKTVQAVCTPDYCESYGESTQYEWIKKVKLGAINNWSGNNNGYADFTNHSTNLYPGQNKTIQLKPGFSNGSYLECWSVFVDWNQDGDFDDAGETETQTSGYGNRYRNISVPYNAASGPTRMRVAMKYGNAYPTACEVFGNGEVEDYTINVIGSQNLVVNTNDELQLDAALELTKVNLTWVNNTGDKNDHFIIEKSMDGVAFSTMKTVENINTEAQAAIYKDSDETPVEGFNYYRIKLVLDDGTTMYSNIKQVELTYNPHEIGLFPNPAENEIFVNATEFEGMKAQIFISSATGQVLQQMQLDAIPGTAIRLPVSELKEGLYFMNIQVEGFRAVTKRFVVAKSGN